MSDAGESDEALIARYAAGDGGAFARLYERHEMSTWRYLERNVGNRATAEEVLQEVWFAVARDAARYRPTARFTTWLFTIARNRMIDCVRTRGRQVSLASVDLEPGSLVGELSTEPSVGPLAAAVVHEQAAAVSQAMLKLPREQRDAFLLQVEGDLSVEEVATIMRSSFETTKSRLRYARTRLRALLREYA